MRVVRGHLRRRIGLIVGWLACALFVPPVARAQEPPLAEVRARLDRLEKEHTQLQRDHAELLRAIQSMHRESAVVPADAREVEHLVRTYLQTQEQQRKLAAERAQAEAAAKGFEVGKDLTLRPTWNLANGLYFETDDKAFKVHVGGILQNDWGWFTQDAALEAAPPVGVGNLQDGTNFRRVRLKVDGTCYEVFEFMTELDFFQAPSVTFRNIWMQVNELPYVGRFRAGHFKEPFCLEELTGEHDFTFMERSLPDQAFVPAFNTGFQLANGLFDERATWALGLFRTTNDQGGSDFGDGEYAVTGRVTGLAWYENDGRCLFHLGVAGSHRSLDNGQVVFQAQPELRIGLPNFVSTGTILAASDELLGLEAAVVHGPLSLQAEWMAARVNDARFPAAPPAPLRGDLTFTGYYVQASYFLTGEHRAYNRRTATFTRLRPHENFWLVRTEEGSSCFGKGAWELAARYSWLDLNDAGINGGIIKEWTVGLNWYWNPNMKVQANYLIATRNGTLPAVDGDARLFGLRFAVEF